ncbi:MAG: S-adenosylmethionine synthetase N-terminal domain-containing protein [Psychroflexus halocasei]
MSFLKITNSVSVSTPDELCKQIQRSIHEVCLEKDPIANVQIHCSFNDQGLSISGHLYSKAEVDINAIAKEKLQELKQGEQNNTFYPTQPKYKYLDFIPKPSHLDKSCYDLVGEDEFFQVDGRIPVVLITQHGVFPPKASYGDKPKRDMTCLEGLKDQIIALTGMVYLSGYEYKGLMTAYVDDELINSLKENNKSLNTSLWKNL